MFKDNPFWKTLICFAPNDDGGAGGGAAGADDDGAGGGDGGEDGAGGNDGAGGAGSWWEDNKRFSDDQRTSLSALGLTVDDPLDALPKLLDMEASAKKRLGASPDQLMQRPKEGQDVSEWLRENGEVFGIPDAPDKYEVEMPENWPQDAEWDKDFEDQARELAHAEGIPQSAFNKLVAMYATKVQSLNGTAESDLQVSNAAMMGQLEKDWGDQTQSKITMAKQAAGLIGEQAGLDNEQIASVAMSLKPKIGDAGIIKLFATIGDMMGEDSMVALNNGGSSLVMTPANARAEIEAMKKPDSEYAQSRKQAQTGDRSAFEPLHKKFLELQKIANG